MRLKKQKNQKKAFTLIELLMVIAIIAILAGLLVATLGNPVASSRDSRRQAELESLEDALGLYFKDNGNYPAWTGSSTEDGLCIEATDDLSGFLVDNGHLPQIPKDPKYDSNNCDDPWSSNCYCYIYQTGALEGSPGNYYSSQYKLSARSEEGDEQFFVQESGGEEKLMAGGGSWPGGYSEDDWSNHIISISNPTEDDLENYQVLVKGGDIKSKGVEPDPGAGYKQLRFFKGSTELAWFREEVSGNSNDNYWVNVPGIADSGTNINLLESTSLTTECTDDNICNSYDDVFDKSLAKRADGEDDDSLKAEWLMDEGTGITLADSSTPDTPEEDNPGTYEGRALEFDGTDDYVDCGNDESLDFGTGDFTLEHWVYPNTFSGDPIQLSKYAGASVGWYIQIKTTGTIHAKYGDGSANDITTLDAISVGEWSHIVFIHDADGNDYIYINGKSSEDQPATECNTDSSTDVIVGKKYGFALNGSIDNVRIYNRALSADEVKAHYLGARNLAQ